MQIPILKSYNYLMTSKRDLVAFKERFEEVNCLIKKDRRLTSLEMRWEQLNSAYLLGKSLGLLKSDQGESRVWRIWAELKEKWLDTPK